MSEWVEFNTGRQRVLLQSEHVLAVLERKESTTMCDLYTTVFVDGITVDHSYAEVESMLLGEDYEDEPLEIDTPAANQGPEVS